MPRLFLDVRPLVFWPAFLVLMIAVLLSLIDLESFLSVMQTLNQRVLDSFGWLFSYGSFYLLLLVILTYCSPLGGVVIGGAAAQPLLSKPRWFFITLCTTLAVGILFWTTAEPIYHLYAPPSSIALESGSAEAASFALGAMYLHWSFTPYAIYTIPALTFALAFYNRGLPFSISSSLKPVFGRLVSGSRADLIDTLALYALITGMAASLGTGAITLVGGAGEIIDISTTPITLGIAIAAIVATFVLSTVSGLKKGIARLSLVNAALLLALGLFVFVAGPTSEQIDFATAGLKHYGENFLSLSLLSGSTTGDDWPLRWSVFYWAVWFAWAPVSALFLGRIGRGYTVREFIRINFLYPASFAVVWIGIFSGTAIHFDLSELAGLNSLLQTLGPEKLLYAVFGELPLSRYTIPLLVFIAFISFVTAADSNTDAIGNLCTEGVTAESEESLGLGIKVLWGSTIGIVSWSMVSYAGIDGIRMLSNLGGIAAITIVLASSLSLCKWLAKPSTLSS
ncbi:MAG: BCCT family transporter [Pseudomonadota bacterium]